MDLFSHKSQEIAEGVCDLPGDVFDVLVEHLSVCAEERKRNLVKGQRRSAVAAIVLLCNINVLYSCRELFNGVFADCDPDKVCRPSFPSSFPSSPPTPPPPTPHRLGV